MSIRFLFIIAFFYLFLIQSCAEIQFFPKKGEKIYSDDENATKLQKITKESPITPAEQKTDAQLKQEDLPDVLLNATPEALLKEARFFSEISKEYWDKHNYEAAKELLDKAYAYLLLIKKQDDKDLNKEIDELRLSISKRIQELHAVQHKKAPGIKSEIPLVVNDKVNRELRSFQGPERDFFLMSYKRSRKYIPEIKKMFREEGLPEELAWLPLIESGFNTRALSPARALGLWQFIPSTGARFGLARDKWVDERMDPEKSTKAAIAYLRALHNIFGDWTTALAAYNCGEGLVLRTIREQKINYLDNFWDLYEKLPEQTARYVPRFIAALLIIKEPEKYGFNFDDLDDFEVIETEKVLIDRPIHLKSLAEKLNIGYKELVDLNPELKLEITPDKPYELRVPASEAENCRICISQLGSSLDYAERLAKIGIDDPKDPKKSKEKNVAQKTNVASTAKNTPISKDDKNRPADKSTKDVKTTQTTEIKTPQQVSKPQPHSPVSPVPNAPSVSVKQKTHSVQKGDTLYSIAKKNNVTVEELMRVNKIKSPQELREGTVLRIP